MKKHFIHQLSSLRLDQVYNASKFLGIPQKELLFDVTLKEDKDNTKAQYVTKVLNYTDTVNAMRSKKVIVKSVHFSLSLPKVQYVEKVNGIWITEMYNPICEKRNAGADFSRSDDVKNEMNLSIYYITDAQGIRNVLKYSTSSNNEIDKKCASVRKELIQNPLPFLRTESNLAAIENINSTQDQETDSDPPSSSTSTNT